MSAPKFPRSMRTLAQLHEAHLLEQEIPRSRIERLDELKMLANCLNVHPRRLLGEGARHVGLRPRNVVIGMDNLFGVPGKSLRKGACMPLS